jgi:hypothetical protein
MNRIKTIKIFVYKIKWINNLFQMETFIFKTLIKITCMDKQIKNSIIKYKIINIS